MLSRSLYISSSSDALTLLADGLAIPPENVLHFEDSSDYTFFSREENALLYTEIEGAFQFALDVYLFRIDLPELEAKLMELSTRGLVIAIPDEADGPLDFFIYEGGKRRMACVYEDEETEIFHIWEEWMTHRRES